MEYEYENHRNRLRSLVRDVLESLEGRDNCRMAVVYDRMRGDWEMGPLLGVGDGYHPKYVEDKFIYELKGWSIRNSFPEDIRYPDEMEDDEETISRFPENASGDMVYSIETKEWGEKEEVIQNAITEMIDDYVRDILISFFQEQEGLEE